MYTFNSTIRYSETDENRQLTVPRLIDYFQDCSTFQSEVNGAGLDYMDSVNMVWVVAAWQLNIFRLPKLGEAVVIGTKPYDFKGFLGYRNFMMETAEGEPLCYANSIWSLVDLTNKRPVYVPEDMQKKFPLEEKLQMEYAPKKISISTPFEKMETIEVRREHLDANHHVNNGRYIHMAAAYLPTGYDTGSLRVEYKKQAFLGDVFYPCVAHDENRYVVSFNDADEKPYVVVEFTGRM